MLDLLCEKCYIFASRGVIVSLMAKQFPLLFLALNEPPKGAFGLFSDLLMGCFNLKFFAMLIGLVFPLFVGL